jgi:hypothetical protein
MIQVAPAIFPGRIGSGCPASFHASTASGDNTIPTPPLVRLLDVAPCEKNSVLSSSKFWSLSDHVSCVNNMDGVSLNVRSILTMWSFFELDCLLEYPLTFCESKITLGNLRAVMPPVAWGCFGFLPLLLSAPSVDNLWSALGSTMHMIACSVQSCVGRYGEPLCSKIIANRTKLFVSRW